MNGFGDPPRDLAYELGLFQRISAVTVNGTPLLSVPLMGKYAFWNRFAQYVFSSDIKRFAATRSFEEYRKDEGGQNKGRSLKGHMVGLVGVFISGVALIVARVRGPRILLSGIDRVSDTHFRVDFRMSALYQYADAHHISYTECFHTVFNQSFLENLFIRKRAALYLEALDTLYSWLKFFGLAKKPGSLTVGNLDGISAEERLFISYLVKKYLGLEGLIEFRVRMFTFFFRAARVKAVWMLDDTRHYHEIALAAKECGIPSYAFQHGHFTQYHTGWLGDGGGGLEYLRPDYLVVWSEYWKNELVRLGTVFPESALLVGGYAHSPSKLPYGIDAQPLFLFPHETDSPKDAVREMMTRILELFPKADVVIKLRQDHATLQQKDLYGSLVAHGRVVFITQLSELKVRPTAALGVYSSFLYDMVRAGIPVGILDVGMDYGEGMIQNGLASRIRKESLEKDIRAVLNVEPAILTTRKELLDSTILFTDTLDSISRACGIKVDKAVG